jgi:ABC-2 type transport system permease protein
MSSVKGAGFTYYVFLTMNKLVASKYWWIYLLIILVGVNYLASQLYYRVDLTQEKRYTLSAPTKKLLSNLSDQVTVTVMLDGEMPAGFKRLANSTRELLQEFKENGKANIRFRFVKPGTEGSDTATGTYAMDSLIKMGLKPTNVRVKTKGGEGEEQRYLFPGALVTYHGRAVPVDFLQSTKVNDGDPFSTLNNAEALLEYKLAHAIQRITAETVPAVGYLLGNGEPLTYNVYDLIEGTLKPNYGFGFIPIDSVRTIPLDFQAVVIVKPTKAFNDQQKLKIDQYIMNGGKVIWLIDRLDASLDSLMRKQSDFVAFDFGLNLEDQLFRYGVRINPDLVQDLQCDRLPLVVGNYGDKPQTQLEAWPYFPLLSSYSGHPIAKNMDMVLSIFPNSIDTVKVNGIKKTILLASSANARSLATPAMVSFNSLKTEEDMKTFNKPNIPIAVLLEGRFTSLFTNRLSQATMDTMAGLYKQPFRAASAEENKMIVVSDGDIVTNVVTQKQGPLTMGYNQFTNYQYANKDFILNSIEYLVNPSGILETRAKDYTLRLLDPEKVEQEKTKWQVINIGAPVLLVLLFGFIYQALRKRKYANK